MKSLQEFVEFVKNVNNGFTQYLSQTLELNQSILLSYLLPNELWYWESIFQDNDRFVISCLDLDGQYQLMVFNSNFELISIIEDERLSDVWSDVTALNKYLKKI